MYRLALTLPCSHYQEKLKAWLTHVQQLSGSQQLPVTANDFEVVQYNLPEENDQKVMLLYKGLPEEDIKKFWEEVRKIRKEEENQSTHNASRDTVIKMEFIDETPLGEIYLSLSAAQEITERLLNQGLFMITEKLFMLENLRHLNSDEQWKDKLTDWLKNVKSTLNVADFKVIVFQPPSKPAFVNCMLFYKGISKEDTEKFWDQI
ncbi:hypothetical protein SRHO_G00258890 [Serrasalmus rhombeus]